MKKKKKDIKQKIDKCILPCMMQDNMPYVKKKSQVYTDEKIKICRVM